MTTLVSFFAACVAIVIIAAFVYLNGAQLSKVPSLILAANVWQVLAAFVVFYAGFPLRGLRWATLLRGTGQHISTRDSMEIIFLSWLVNCVVPAKLGDVYRAWLLRLNYVCSLSRTFGTVFLERVLDLMHALRRRDEQLRRHAAHSGTGGAGLTAFDQHHLVVILPGRLPRAQAGGAGSDDGNLDVALLHDLSPWHGIRSNWLPPA